MLLSVSAAFPSCEGSFSVVEGAVLPFVLLSVSAALGLAALDASPVVSAVGISASSADAKALVGSMVNAIATASTLAAICFFIFSVFSLFYQTAVAEKCGGGGRCNKR